MRDSPAEGKPDQPADGKPDRPAEGKPDRPADGKPDRRPALIAAAYNRIASDGFDGLRTLDVAADVGVNIATLHNYFPTKEALVQAVIGYTIGRFRSTLPAMGTPLVQLRGHLFHLRSLLKEDPQLWAVMG